MRTSVFEVRSGSTSRIVTCDRILGVTVHDGSSGDVLMRFKPAAFYSARDLQVIECYPSGNGSIFISAMSRASGHFTLLASD